MSLRKALHNKLVELRGNIRVLCRVRPPITEDGEGLQATVVVKPDTEDDTVVRVFSKGVWKEFEVDKVHPPQSTQQEVCMYMYIEVCTVEHKKTLEML